MSGRSEILFNVIFVPGTVRILSPFILSLLNSSPGCSFRLVSNGCHREEDERLRVLADSDRRLHFYRINSPKPLDHGAALSILQRIESSPVFAFMDSDIFATGDFVEGLNWDPTDCSAMFSCPPVWSNPELETLPEGYGVLSGVYNRLHDGFCVGSSYFAMYDNDILSKVISSTGVNFQKSVWGQLPEPLRAELVAAGRQMILYDTGKLLNILLQLRAANSIQFKPDSCLEHIGGVSGTGLSRARKSARLAFGSWLRLAKAIQSLGRHGDQPQGWRELASPEERCWIDARSHRRRVVCTYFSDLMTSLASEVTPDTALHYEDDNCVRETDRVTSLLRSAYPDWYQEVERMTRVDLSNGAIGHKGRDYRRTA